MVAGTLPGRREDVERGVGAFELLEAANQLDEGRRLQEDEPTGDVVVRECAEGLVAQRYLTAQSPRSGRIGRSGRQQGHVLVDPAESVDRDLFDEEFLDVAHFGHFLICNQRLTRHTRLLGPPYSVKSAPVRATSRARLGP